MLKRWLRAAGETELSPPAPQQPHWTPRLDKQLLAWAELLAVKLKRPAITSRARRAPYSDPTAILLQ